MVVTMDANEVKQNFFDILVATREEKQITKIKVNGVVVAKIIPEEEKAE